MGAATDITTWAAAQLGWYLPVSAVMLLALVLACIMFWRQVRRLEQHYRQLTHGVDERDLLASLDAHLRRIGRAEERLSAAEGRLTAAEEQARWPVQDFGVVRFDAFDDVGGKVSFAVALLDDHGQGIVLSSLFGRDGSSTYAKAVGPGSRDAELSDEERDALELARQRAKARAEAGRQAGRV